MGIYHSASGSQAEDLFIELFCEAFGVEKAAFLYTQYPFFDIYQNSRFADFVLENSGRRIAIEIDDEASHNKTVISREKFYDDLLKQNSMVFLGWDVFRFAVKQIQEKPDTVKDELRVFLGTHPLFKEIQDYLPKQRGKAFELKNHQYEALKTLQEMRTCNETIALLYHATGTGKTVTAVLDAKSLGGRTLFLAHTKELVSQSFSAFSKLWPDVSIGLFVENIKQLDTCVVCGSIQSVALNLERFKEDDFDYLIVDEAHHASADSYQKVLAFFRPKFTLGLTATPERNDEKNILEIFKNVAHKLDIKTAVEIGELVPVRCIRIHTNIDITKVRMNGIRYNSLELESKIYVPERNQLIVDTWLQFVKNKRTVVFCASIKHAEEIAKLFNEKRVKSVSISGTMKSAERKEILENYEIGNKTVLCACDLLNEGWDSPRTEVLFMARPTMSKVLYTQQLGRGMRTAENKDFLVVFDFVDNANRYNMPYSMHRLFQLKDYKPGRMVVAPQSQKVADEALYAKGEKPEAIVDYPISAKDFELVDIFNWQEEVADMISQMEFVRRVNVQSETVEDYVRTGKIIPDIVIPMSEAKSFKYFKEETLRYYAEMYGWVIINDENRKEIFMNMIRIMDMSYSYKPILLKAILTYADEKGRVKISDLVLFFKEYFEKRRSLGLTIEKPNSIYSKGGYTDKDIEHNILVNPFKRFEDMTILKHTKTLGIIEVDSVVWKRLSVEEIVEIKRICDEKLLEYYDKIDSKEECRKGEEG